MHRRTKRALGVIGALTLLAGSAWASSHREAPFITKNPKVDGTDFYSFRSYETGREGFVTLIANYIPLQDAYGGPNYFTLDPEALYEIQVDNNGDAVEDVTFQFRFQNTLSGGTGITLPIGTGAQQKNVAVPFVAVGQVTAADQSKLNQSESYTLKIVRGDRRTGNVADIAAVDGNATFTKPTDYIGKKTFPDYVSYVKPYIYEVNIPGCTPPAGTHARVFVGQRKESFSVNLGQIFDLINIANPLGPRDQGLNSLTQKNVTSLALEIPISCLRGSNDVIGAWTTASVRQARVINPNATFALPAKEGGAFAQVSRLGMPLVNELIIGLKDKDHFNASIPKNDAQFLEYVTNPTLPAVVELLFGAAGVRAPTLFPRADLVTVFLTGVDGVNKTATPSEMQRLNMALPATPKGKQNNLGAAGCFVNGTLNVNAAGCDPAGFPNGRRPGDDVVDVELRVSMGFLLPANVAPSGALPFTDGAIVADSDFDNAFPYLRTPIPGSP